MRYIDNKDMKSAMKRNLLVALALVCSFSLSAQEERKNHGPIDLTENLQYNVEAQASFSEGKTPLWMNANRYGLSSLDEMNGYLRAGVERPLRTDSLRRWGVGYGVDVAVPYHFTSSVVVQQAYAEARWLHGALTVGSKQQPMELKNNRLSTGSQTLGINARPVPQVRLSLPDYWTLPGTNYWVHLKGHIAYGKMTDQNWQHDFTARQQNYADGMLYHSKAGYLKIGKEDCFYPLSVELGLEMASTFGGTAHVRQLDGTMQTYEGEKGLKSMWHAFVPGGADSGENVYQNAEGDQLGSWMARVNWDSDTWRLSFYADKFFEDHSSMLQLDYDGYGEGNEWQAKKKRRYLLYDFKDWMLGTELQFKYGTWLRHIVFEYLYTKYQSGPIYHDHTPGLKDHVAGMDNFYNHYIYPGWQHWGQVMGNPLYRSPLYNDDGSIEVLDNRFTALHLGLDGGYNDFSYRLLATWQQGVGTYHHPFTRSHHNLSVLLEGIWQPTKGALRGWTLSAAYGMDLGAILGNNYGLQITVARHGLFKDKKK